MLREKDNKKSNKKMEDQLDQTTPAPGSILNSASLHATFAPGDPVCMLQIPTPSESDRLSDSAYSKQQSPHPSVRKINAVNLRRVSIAEPQGFGIVASPRRERRSSDDTPTLAPSPTRRVQAAVYNTHPSPHTPREDTPPPEALFANTVELVPHSPGVTAAVFLETAQHANGSTIEIQGSPERLAHYSHGGFYEAKRVKNVLQGLEALEGSGQRRGSHADDVFSKENSALENEVTKAKARIEELQTALKEKARSRSTSMRKLRSAALMLGMGAVAKRRAPRTSICPTTNPEAAQRNTTQTVLDSEQLRREVFIEDVLETPKVLKPRDPHLMKYSFMHVADTHNNRFLKAQEQKRIQIRLENEKEEARKQRAEKEEEEQQEKQKADQAEAERKKRDDVQIADALTNTVSSGAQLAKIMDEVFELIDTNNDGNIDLHEVQSFTNTFPSPPSEPKLRTLFTVADRDGSGSIEKDEFLSLLRLLEGTLRMPATLMMDYFRRSCISRLFDELDEDGDGTLTSQEVRSLVHTLQHDCAQIGELRKVNIRLNHTREEIHTMFRQMDDDNSGELDQEEFVNFVKRIVGDVPVSWVTNSFLKGRKIAKDKMKAKLMTFGGT